MYTRCKKLIATLLVAVFILNDTSIARASFMDAYEDIWNKSASDDKAGKKVPTKAFIKANTKIWTSTPVFWKHKLNSDGISEGGIKNKIGGYKYKVPKQGHKIIATLSGLSVSLSCSDLSTVETTNNSETYCVNGYSAGYEIDGQCVNLYQYTEKHSIQVDAYAPRDRITPQETITAKTTLTLY